MAARVRVLVVDDSPFMRNMLVRMIGKDARLEVVGTATNGQEGVDQAKLLKPDVITMDIEMPVMTGLEALDRIMKECPAPVVMVSTLTEEGARVTVEALAKGAVDYLPKALQSKDNNIFSAADALHEKLLNAAGARVKQGGATAPVAKPAQASASANTNAQQVAKRSKILLVGSSTGGPKALHTLIAELPANLRVPVVVAQHMPAEFTGAMASRLNDTCKISVKEAVDGEPLRAGVVYIAPGAKHTRIAGGAIKLGADKGESPFKPSVDVLADSAQQAYAGDVVAVMLTGMGSDGAKAYASLKQAGAHIIAQDEASSVVYGMPRAVVERGAASEILTLTDIGPRLRTLYS
ncbi:MAG: chemotaxis response regulator protein-glutamate methylesterase [Alphaproteobacteria bacterium]